MTSVCLERLQWRNIHGSKSTLVVISKNLTPYADLLRK